MKAGTIERPAPARGRAGPEIRFACIMGPPPEPGDNLCWLLTGHTEAELVDRILDGFCPQIRTEAMAG